MTHSPFYIIDRRQFWRSTVFHVIDIRNCYLKWKRQQREADGLRKFSAVDKNSWAVFSIHMTCSRRTCYELSKQPNSIFRDCSEHKAFQVTSVLVTVHTVDATLSRYLRSSGRVGLDFSLTLVISWGVELPYWFYPGFFIIQFQTFANNGAVALSFILSPEPISIVLR